MCCSTGPRLLDNTFVMWGMGGGWIIPCIPKNSLTLSSASKNCFLKLSVSQTFCIWLVANLN